MCGRFTSQSRPEKLQQAFKLAGISMALPPRYNIAPSQPVPAVVNDGRRVLEPLHWGLVPGWAKDPRVGSRMINARVESLEEKAAFREAFERRRCVVLADGFYEWKKIGSRKVPYYIRRKDREPFAFAGLWDRWRGGEETLRSCTVITVPPAGLFAELHDRMPAILTAEQVDAWLSPGAEPSPKLKALLAAVPAEEWEAYPVASLVNAPDYDQPDCIAPAPDELEKARAAPVQLSLLDGE